MTLVVRAEGAVELALGPRSPAPYRCEPRLLRLRSGRVLLSYRIGSSRASADGTQELLCSDDDGRTWSSLGTPFEAHRPSAWDFRRASLTELDDGTVLAAILAINKSSGLPIYNPATEGVLPIHALFARSDDAGEHWSAPWPLEGIAIPQLAPECVLAPATGETLCTYERFKEYDDGDVWRYQAGLIRSRDGGATWSDPTVAAASDYDNDPHDTMWWDPRLAKLADGTLIQYYAAFCHREAVDGLLHVAWSNDGGRRWTPPVATALPGQMAFPVPCGGGVLLFQQRRTSGTMVVARSEDGGRQFVDEQLIYTHAEPSAPGGVGSFTPAQYMQSMDGFTFGHPTGVELRSGRVLLCWYAGSYDRTLIRSATIEIAT